jgi:hypothetical protein
VSPAAAAPLDSPLPPATPLPPFPMCRSLISKWWAASLIKTWHKDCWICEVCKPQQTCIVSSNDLALHSWVPLRAMVILRMAWSLVRPLTVVVVCLQLTLQYASGLPAQSKGPIRLYGSYVWWLPVGYVIANSADSSSCLPPAFSQTGFRQYSVVESQLSASCRGDTRATFLPLSNAADKWTVRLSGTGLQNVSCQSTKRRYMK